MKTWLTSLLVLLLLTGGVAFAAVLEDGAPCVAQAAPKDEAPAGGEKPKKDEAGKPEKKDGEVEILIVDEDGKVKKADGETKGRVRVMMKGVPEEEIGNARKQLEKALEFLDPEMRRLILKKRAAVDGSQGPKGEAHVRVLVEDDDDEGEDADDEHEMLPEHLRKQVLEALKNLSPEIRKQVEQGLRAGKRSFSFAVPFNGPGGAMIFGGMPGQPGRPGPQGKQPGQPCPQGRPCHPGAPCPPGMPCRPGMGRRPGMWGQRGTWRRPGMWRRPAMQGRHGMRGPRCGCQGPQAGQPGHGEGIVRALNGLRQEIALLRKEMAAMRGARAGAHMAPPRTAIRIPAPPPAPKAVPAPKQGKTQVRVYRSVKPGGAGGVVLEGVKAAPQQLRVLAAGTKKEAALEKEVAELKGQIEDMKEKMKRMAKLLDELTPKKK